MKKLLINNTSESDIIILNSNNSYIINSKNKQFIEIDDDILFIRKFDKVSSCLKIGRYYLKDTIRSGWIFLPIIMLDFVSVVRIGKYIKSIEVSEKKLCFLYFTIFSLIYINQKPAELCRFNTQSDKRKFTFLACLFLLPLVLFCILLLIGCFKEITVEFSTRVPLMFLLFVGTFCLLISMVKSIARFREINKNFSKVLSVATVAQIYSQGKRIVVYTDIDEDK